MPEDLAICWDSTADAVSGLIEDGELTIFHNNKQIQYGELAYQLVLSLQGDHDVWKRSGKEYDMHSFLRTLVTLEDFVNPKEIVE